VHDRVYRSRKALVYGGRRDVVIALRKPRVIGVAGIAVVAALCLLGTTSCTSSGSGSTTGASKGSTLVINTFMPFSGPDAYFGPFDDPGCFAAVRLINAEGGVLGHHFSCGTVDTRGDPADAVLAANKMIATTSNLVGIIGPSSDEAASTTSILNRAKIPFFSIDGLAEYDYTHLHYYWRLLPADALEGYAMALWAHHVGYTTGATVFANDIAAQGQVPGVTKGFEKLGGHIVLNEAIASDQTSYESVIQRIIAAHPQVIFSETDGQTAGTLFAELRQAHHMIPVIETNASVGTNFSSVMEHAIGKASYAKYFRDVGPYTPATGPGWAAYARGLMASAAQVPKPAQYKDQSYPMTNYDGVNLMALAMLAAKSTSPSVYDNYILSLGQPGQGKVTVHTFAEGKAELAAGHHIYYDGASGPVTFTRYHNSSGGFDCEIQADNYRVCGVLPSAEVTHLALGH
jgi:ABC-type branched-subunit amino acid transport system substrate-binding protein